jgi:UDP-2-acetamido-3-amino-2,3-dideoxy-glucuronate N-acetyltransferase
MVFDERMSSSRPAVPVAVPRVVNLNAFADSRGTLVAADGAEELPFPPVRYFLIHGVPADATRARHALRHGHELISCVAGACTIELRWGSGHATHRLADPATALHLPPWVWVECRGFSEDAVLLVLCSEPYDPADQITDIAEFEAGPAAPA